MAKPTTRQGLIDYCLRDLGHPVIEINVDDDQLEDRVDEALEFFREFHYDAIELTYVKQEITASTLRLQSLVGLSFTVGETITGGTSGATATVVSLDAANLLSIKGITGTFTASETITGGTSGTSAVIYNSSPVTKGVFDNQYIELNDSITGVVKVLPLSERSSTVNLFDVRYQLMLNNIQSLTATDLVYYTQLKTHLNLINDLMAGQKPVRFNRHTNTLYIDLDWKSDVDVGDYVVIECFKILDPNTYTDVYNDYFLKKYLSALIKRQWGNNLKKFEGVQMPGGVTLNGQKIFDEAVEELKELKLEAQEVWQLPPDMFVG